VTRHTAAIDLRLSVLIADDHAFTLLGLQHQLQSDDRFEVIATATDGIDAIRLTRMHQPQIALLDFAMPKASGLEALIEIARWVPETKVAVLTAREDSATITALTNAGAAGVLSKSEGPEITLEHLVSIGRGERIVSAPFQELLAGTQDMATLSPRETEVLIRIAKGLSNPRIAEELTLSPKTVESHRASLMRKLEVNTTATLLLKAAKAGLIDL